MDDDLAHRAERATLGAMVCDQRLAARLDCLEARDFTDPRHRAVFQAVRTLSGTPLLASDDWRALIAATAGRPVKVGDLDGYAAACPDPAHGPAYSAMLIQASLYRLARERVNDLDAQAALLGYEERRVADAGWTSGRQSVGIGGHLAEVARAIRGHTAVLAPSGPDSTARPSPRDTDLHNPFAAAPTWSGELATAAMAERREELVLSALLQRHAQAGQILDFLPAAAFTSQVRQEIFRAVHRLSMTDRPVDELTVRWDLATHAATTAVVSPGGSGQSQVPEGYVDKLARAAISGERSPLRVSHDLSALLRNRNSFRQESASARRPGESLPADGPGNAVQSGLVPAQGLAPTLNRPPHPAETRQPGREQRR